MQVIVFNYQIYDSYESDTLKYWIERPNSNYIISRIWVEDAYNQMRVAITNEVNSNITPVKTWPSSFQSQYDRANEINQCINDPNRTYHMYNVMDSDVLLNNEISKKNYNNKGLYVVNCSPMVSTYWSTSAPCDWFGTATIPLVINEGTVIRDSTDGALFSNRSVLGLTNNNEIKSYSFKKGNNEDEISNNKATVKKIKEDGVKYTFANFGTLVNDYKVKTSSSDNNIRTSLCQIDEHNYILISSTVSDTSTEIRDVNGISLLKMANDMVEYGCKTGYNFDGGGSQTSYYIKNNNIINYIRPRSYDGRGLADLFYFVEK
jgi:exopolysaccharide biosynthesis protein